MPENTTIKVCMLSYRHNLTDDRIYEKEALALHRMGYEVICAGYGAEDKDYVSSDGIRIIQLAKKRRHYSLRGFISILREFGQQNLFELAKAVSADVYHLHDLELCRIALKLKCLPQCPKVIYDAHEPYPENFKDFWRKRSLFRIFFSDIPALIAERRILPRVDYLIATEENVASRFKRKNPNTAIVYNYSSFYPKEKSSPKEYDAVYCGSLLASKGITQMIDLALFLKAHGNDLKFLFIGGFYDKRLENGIREKIRRNHLENNVVFTGEIPFKEVQTYYSKSKMALCLFPSNRTNRLILPIKLFEYMAFGLPIVGSNFGHIQEIILSNQTGLVADPDNIEDTAKAVLTLLQNEKYKEYYLRCISAVKEKYFWETQIKTLSEIYNAVL